MKGTNVEDEAASLCGMRHEGDRRVRGRDKRAVEPENGSGGRHAVRSASGDLLLTVHARTLELEGRGAILRFDRRRSLEDALLERDLRVARDDDARAGATFDRRTRGF